jgi:hypothetical protein
MSNVYDLSSQALGPDDLRLAADAFEAALHSLDESTCNGPPHAARRLLARYVIERTLSGERDVTVLRDGALSWLRNPRVSAAA